MMDNATYYSITQQAALYAALVYAQNTGWERPSFISAHELGGAKRKLNDAYKTELEVSKHER
jgi:hypothetical protein